MKLQDLVEKQTDWLDLFLALRDDSKNTKEFINKMQELNVDKTRQIIAMLSLLLTVNIDCNEEGSHYWLPIFSTPKGGD